MILRPTSQKALGCSGLFPRRLGRDHRPLIANLADSVGAHAIVGCGIDLGQVQVDDRPDDQRAQQF